MRRGLLAGAPHACFVTDWVTTEGRCMMWTNAFWALTLLAGWVVICLIVLGSS